MTAVGDRVLARTDLVEDERHRLAELQAEWQIIADLAFADLVLWAKDANDDGLWAVGQTRPSTGPTALVDDVVGTRREPDAGALLDRAFASGRIARAGDPQWWDVVPVRVEAIPVRHRGRTIAVVERTTNLHGIRPPSGLELAYLDAAARLSEMVAEGAFPFAAPVAAGAESPRVGDGFIRLDPDGVVGYASPNASSLFRRLGLTEDLSGHRLASVVRRLVADRGEIDEEELSVVLSARAPAEAEWEAGAVTVTARSLPLRSAAAPDGGIVLVRDVTDLRRRDRELLTKEATIKEVHHRVKNNLQTVAALLRLQARRLDEGPAREALTEAVRRVGAIAVVHETLSRAFDERVAFDEVADGLIRQIAELAPTGERVPITRSGSFGTVGSERATALAMMVTELVHNALAHGYPVTADTTIESPTATTRPGGAWGEVLIRVGSTGPPTALVVEVIDDGVGLPAGFEATEPTGLGLMIVRTLVADARGTVDLVETPGGGTTARIILPGPL